MEQQYALEFKENLIKRIPDFPNSKGGAALSFNKGSNLFEIYKKTHLADQKRPDFSKNGQKTCLESTDPTCGIQDSRRGRILRSCIQ